jgi:transketolase
MTTSFDEKLVKKSGDYIRYLSLMGIERANSGHPGLPLGCADFSVLLYQYFLKNTPEKADWLNRDRFVLSAGHGSMLLYSLKYLYGYNYSINDLANFRQLDSITPGHPEYDPKEGIETTTGPLGQGFTNAVGMAIEEKMLRARFNTPSHLLFGYNIITLMGDGCHMEGITNEAASMAGHLGLDNLTAVYDSNRITIDGDTDITFTEDVAGRYKALGWETDEIDGSNIKKLYKKLSSLIQKRGGKPKLLIMKTSIGEGLNELKGSHKIHGAPAGIDEIAYFIKNSTLTKAFCSKNNISDSIDDIKSALSKELESSDFLSLSSLTDVKSFIEERNASVKTLLSSWENLFSDYASAHKDNAQLLDIFIQQKVPEGLKEELLSFSCDNDATRNVSAKVLELVTSYMPQLVGGSADLVGSTKATVKGSTYITKDDFSGRNIAFGVRENGMGSIGNGLGLSKLFIPFTSTFFTFLDYMKPAVRLAAIMRLKHLFIFTHDSFYVGEDGPTHQPIEHIGSLRLIPDLHTFRPCNDIETALSYLYFLEHDLPAVILGTRQKLPAGLFNKKLDNNALYISFKKGAYTFYQTSDEKPDIILAASGSEVGSLYEIKDELESSKKIRIVSIPCMELFEAADAAYQEELLGNGDTPVFFLEAASRRGFKLFQKENVTIKGVDTFGLSGPYTKLADYFGFTKDKLIAAIK